MHLRGHNFSGLVGTFLVGLFLLSSSIMLYVALKPAIRSQRENGRHSDFTGRLITMKRVLELLVLATILALCSAGCQPGLYGHPDWYQCVDITDISEVELQVPNGVVGLEIINSSIETLPTGAFSRYGQTLEQFNITGSGLKIIESSAFSGLPKLTLLGIVNNLINVLDEKWLKDLYNVKRLITWGNHISEITGLYDLLPNLEYWDMAYNEMSTCLQADNLAKLIHLKDIYIAGNHWSYRCRPSMTRCLRSHGIHFVDDWGTRDQLIEDCLAHDYYAQIDDGELYRCVKRKIETYEMADLHEHVRDLIKKVTDLQVDVGTLKKNIH